MQKENFSFTFSTEQIKFLRRKLIVIVFSCKINVILTTRKTRQKALIGTTESSLLTWRLIASHGHALFKFCCRLVKIAFSWNKLKLGLVQSGPKKIKIKKVYPNLPIYDLHLLAKKREKILYNITIFLE